MNDPLIQQQRYISCFTLLMLRITAHRYHRQFYLQIVALKGLFAFALTIKLIFTWALSEFELHYFLLRFAAILLLSQNILVTISFLIANFYIYWQATVSLSNCSGLNYSFVIFYVCVFFISDILIPIIFLSLGVLAILDYNLFHPIKKCIRAKSQRNKVKKYLDRSILKDQIEMIDQEIIKEGDGNCSICLSKKSSQDVRTQCGHRFHYECLQTWLEGHHTCPICRAILLQ